MDEKNDALQNSLNPEAVQPPVPPTPVQPLDPLPEINIPSLRTYKGDLSQTVNKDKITTAKILMAEARQKEKSKINQDEVSIKRPTNAIALVFGTLFLIAGIGAVGYFGYTKVINPNPISSLPAPTFFLFAFDNQEYIQTSRTRTDVMVNVDEIKQKSFSAKPNSYTELIYIKTDEETEEDMRISSIDLFNLYQVRLPITFGRSLANDFVYGLYKTGDRVEPFLVLSLLDAEYGYTSMFEWEETLALDLQDFFPNLKELFAVQNVPPSDEVPTNVEDVTNEQAPAEEKPDNQTALVKEDQVPTEEGADETPVQNTVDEETSTQPINRTVRFTDVVLSNRDTRAIRDANGTPFFFYTFIERDKILFAQDPKLIAEIVRKIKEKQLVR